MPSQVNKPANKQNPIMSMIMPGRRSLGEKWRKISIHPDPDTGTYLIDNEETEAPATNRAIFVPGLGNISTEMADYILEKKRDDAISDAVKPRKSQAEVDKEVNAMWHDYMEQKLAMFKGKTTLGPAGFFQREANNAR